MRRHNNEKVLVFFFFIQKERHNAGNDMALFLLDTNDTSEETNGVLQEMAL